LLFLQMPRWHTQSRNKHAGILMMINCNSNLNTDDDVIKWLSNEACENEFNCLWQQYGRYLLVWNWHDWNPSIATERVWMW
jgi:hypothetical protein